MTQQSKDYAQALYALAKESAQEAAFLPALESLSAALFEQPAYPELLNNPAIPTKERLAALAEALPADTPAHVRSFLLLLCAKRHIRCLPACVAEYRHLYETAAGRSTARVVSAVPLSHAQQERLCERLAALSGRAVQLDCTVDETLLAGITVELDGTVLDGSLKHRLQEVKEVMQQ